MITNASGLLLDEARLRASADRGDFTAAMADAIAGGRGFAAAKIGVSEQAWLSLPFLLERSSSRLQRRAIEVAVREHCKVQSGVFPTETVADLLEFSRWHARAVRELDFMGLAGGHFESDLIRHHAIGAQTIDYIETEPDRSIPSRDEECYLPLFAGKRLLIVSSIAELLRSRADRDTFEAVWAKTGKRWFAPAEVHALEFPFVYDAATQQRYGSSQNLFTAIAEQIDPDTFDVALIAGASLGIPIAAHIKSLGKQCVALGGHLQVLFGVQGKRWRDQPEWQRDYVTEAWIDTPAHYIPRNSWGLVDSGAYW